MKAKEYFARLDGISKEDLFRMAEKCGTPEGEEAWHKWEFFTIAATIIRDLLVEARDIMKARGVERDSAAISVLKEVRQRWEAVCHMIEQKYGLKCFDKHTFNHLLKEKMPELAIMLPPDFWR